MNPNKKRLEYRWPTWRAKLLVGAKSVGKRGSALLTNAIK